MASPEPLDLLCHRIDVACVSRRIFCISWDYQSTLDILTVGETLCLIFFSYDNLFLSDVQRSHSLVLVLDLLRPLMCGRMIEMSAESVPSIPKFRECRSLWRILSTVVVMLLVQVESLAV